MLVHPIQATKSAGGGKQQIFTDTFTDTNGTDILSHTMDSGQTWMNFADTLLHWDSPASIQSNSLVPTTPTDTNNTAILVNEAATSSLQVIEIDWTPNDPSNTIVDLIGRCNNDPDDNLVDFYVGQWNGFNGGWRIFHNLGDATGFIADSILTTDVIRIKLEITATAVHLYRDGVLKATLTDMSGPANGYVGLFYNYSGVAGFKLDNFSATIG